MAASRSADAPGRLTVGARLRAELAARQSERSLHAAEAMNPADAEMRPRSLGSAEAQNAAEAELRSIMAHVRSEVVGDNSAWKCEMAARALCDRIRQAGLEERLQRGKVAVARGAFVNGAPLSSSSGYLPATAAWGGSIPIPPSGVPHAFVRFEDGTIADITADQFDRCLPSAWFPADPARYVVGAKVSLWEAVNAHVERQRAAARKPEVAAREWWH